MKSEKPTIAIVEDEKDLCLLLVKLFQKRGIPISYIAHDGYDAESKFRGANPKPDIIIMDYRLQSTMGTSVARNILELEPSTKIIFLSADFDVEEEAYAAGAFLFLKKPASFKIIEEAVEIANNNTSRHVYRYNGFRVKEP
jgi:DNA-binding response OmpR family regulator